MEQLGAKGKSLLHTEMEKVCCIRIPFLIACVAFVNATGQVDMPGHINRPDTDSCRLQGIVTAASSEYFIAVLNLVGSLHVYEPKIPIDIYNLGLTQRQVQVVLYVHNIQLIEFPFDDYPEHIRNLKNYGWKAAVIKEAVERRGSILYLDAGMELRFFLSDLKSKLAHHGQWFVQSQEHIGKYAHPGTFRALALGKKVFMKSKGGGFEEFDWEATIYAQPTLATGMMGWCANSTLWQDLFSPWLRCSMQLDCILPAGANASNHRWEQSALSILFHDLQLTRHPDLFSEKSRKYWVSGSVISAEQKIMFERPDTHVEGIYFWARRRNLPKPFVRFVKVRFSAAAVTLPFAKCGNPLCPHWTASCNVYKDALGVVFSVCIACDGKGRHQLQGNVCAPA